MPITTCLFDTCKALPDVWADVWADIWAAAHAPPGPGTHPNWQRGSDGY